jgi:hypothetical protein
MGDAREDRGGLLRELHTLDERDIIRTLEVLRNRVAERFPTRGLTKTASHLLDLSRVTAAEAAALRNPYWAMRLVPILAIAFALAGFGMLYRLFTVIPNKEMSLADFAQGLDATLNIILISGIAIGFFLRLENRRKRTVALNGLYQLRAVSHVIDMHQLTKDPAAIVGRERTDSSPLRDLTPEQLSRYLDYCTEMLSLTGKLAALYAQYFPDATVVAAVNDVEQLTTNLSRKIWQKIVLVQQNPTAD